MSNNPKHKIHRGMHKIENNIELKKCHCCKIFKPLSEYLFDNSTWDKLTCKCYLCYTWKGYMKGYPPYTAPTVGGHPPDF